VEIIVSRPVSATIMRTYGEMLYGVVVFVGLRTIYLSFIMLS